MTSCSVTDCSKPAYIKGLCTTHYKRQWRHGDATTKLTRTQYPRCTVDGCSNPPRARDLCDAHYQMQRVYGRTERIKAVYGTGRTKDTNGYVVVTLPSGVRQYEHILVAEKALGKPLPRGAIVHHIDENKSHNANTNLVICPDQSYHMLIHKRMRDLGISFRTADTKTT